MGPSCHFEFSDLETKSPETKKVTTSHSFLKGWANRVRPRPGCFQLQAELTSVHVWHFVGSNLEDVRLKNVKDDTEAWLADALMSGGI